MPISVVGHAADASGRAQARSRKLHAQAPWYVVQVTAGREDHMRSVIEQAVEAEEKILSELAEAQAAEVDSDADPLMRAAAGSLPGARARADEAASPIVERLFVPKARVGVKQGGKWVQGEEVLLPGYLVAETARPDALSRALRRVGGFARVVRRGDVFEPMPEEAVRWVEAHTGGGSEAAEMSEGYVEDGVLHVTSGPLVGREASIVHVSHRKKVAYLELEAFGRTITAQLGINITRSKSCKKKQKRE